MFISRICSVNPENISIKKMKACHKKTIHIDLVYFIACEIWLFLEISIQKNVKLEASNDIVSNKMIGSYLYGRFILFLPNQHADNAQYLSLVHRFLRQLCLIFI